MRRVSFAIACAVLALALVALPVGPAVATDGSSDDLQENRNDDDQGDDDQGDDDGDRDPFFRCRARLRQGAVPARCFDALLAEPEVEAVLGDPERVPALADGRLALPAMLERLQISDAVPRTRLGAEADPDEIVVVDPRRLRELRAGEGFEIATSAFTRRGPITLERYVPPPGTGFPLVPRPDNRFFLDIPAFTLQLHETLFPNVNGYAMRMRVNGQTVSTLQWEWARNPQPEDAPAAPWNTNRRIHIVSLSKLMSAIGLVHLLDAKGIDTKAKIIDFLPDYWNPGPNVGLIDFEHLMNHVSGFSTGPGSASDWATMQSIVEGGVSASDVGVTGDYENLNFGLLRILITTIGGYIDPSADVGSEFFNDLLWAAFTSSSYDHYMQTNVFNPVGAFPVLIKSPSTALAHRYDASGTGWNSGSFFGSPGGVGWHMTVNEVLDVARALRTGQILDPPVAQKLLDQSWGLNSPFNGETTDAGPIYYKPGLWQDNSDASVARTEQCVLLMAPNGMEIVVFVNSPVTASGDSLQNLVRTIYMNNLVTFP